LLICLSADIDCPDVVCSAVEKAPSPPLEKAASDDEDEVFSVSVYSSDSDRDLSDVEGLEEEPTVPPEITVDGPTTPVIVEPEQSSSQTLVVPRKTVEHETEEEVIKKGGMTAAIARSFVVSIGY